MKKLLISLFCICLTATISAEISQTEKNALIDLYTSTQGDKWIQSWDLSAPIDQWQGVTVENDHVVAIRLLFNNMQGSLPNTIGDLQHLKILELSFNKLSGELPGTLGELSNLEILALNANYFTGEIPETFGNLIALKQLHLSSNKLMGLVPFSIGEIQSLQVLNVFDNSLSGEFPVNVVQLKYLKELVIAENDFTNFNQFPIIPMINTAGLDLHNTDGIPSAKSVIAIELEEGN